MGNCALKDCYNNTNPSTLHDISIVSADATKRSMIKVVTTTGGIMELYAPITAEQITSEFPNHGLFLSPNPNPTQPPVPHSDTLCPGKLYYLLPLSHSSTSTTTNTSSGSSSSSNNNYNYNSLLSTPYRMSVDMGPRVVYRSHPDPDVVPRYNGSGVWKVRLVINPEQLSDILSQDNKTQQLIESVRTVAKCGNNNNNNAISGGAKTSSSVGTSTSNNSDDQSSVSSCNFRW